MAAITKEVQAELDSLRYAADSGALPARFAVFIRQTINGVYAAPGNFRSSIDMCVHLETLTELINLYIYRG